MDNHYRVGQLNSQYWEELVRYSPTLTDNAHYGSAFDSIPYTNKRTNALALLGGLTMRL